MDLEKTIVTLKKELEYFGLNHKCSKLELYRKYQKYLKYWKLDNFETIDEKLLARKKIEKAHKAYDFIKANWNFLVLLKNKEESYLPSIEKAKKKLGLKIKVSFRKAILLSVKNNDKNYR